MHCSTAFGTHVVVLRCPCYERGGGHDGEAMRGQRGAWQLWGGEWFCNQDVNTGDRTASDNRICAK